MADEQLVVRLEARINDFEKSMKRAENTGTRTWVRVDEPSSGGCQYCG